MQTYCNNFLWVLREKLLFYFILDEWDRTFKVSLKWSRVAVTFPLLHEHCVVLLSLL